MSELDVITKMAQGIEKSKIKFPVAAKDHRKLYLGSRIFWQQKLEHHTGRIVMALSRPDQM